MRSQQWRTGPCQNEQKIIESSANWSLHFCHHDLIFDWKSLFFVMLPTWIISCQAKIFKFLWRACHCSHSSFNQIQFKNSRKNLKRLHTLQKSSFLICFFKKLNGFKTCKATFSPKVFLYTYYMKCLETARGHTYVSLVWPQSKRNFYESVSTWS